jgi:hypothetical protein
MPYDLLILCDVGMIHRANCNWTEVHVKLICVCVIIKLLTGRLLTVNWVLCGGNWYCVWSDRKLTAWIALKLYLHCRNQIIFSVCVCVCMCVSVCTWICESVWMCARECVCLCVSVFTWECVCVRERVWMYVWECVCVSVCGACVSVCVCVSVCLWEWVCARVNVREYAKECAWVSVFERVCECVCVSECECVYMSASVGVWVCVTTYIYQMSPFVKYCKPWSC